MQDFKEKIINWKPGDFLLQQFLPGKIISASVLSTDNQAKTIITSENLINKENPASNQPYVYQGNISPHAGNDEIKRLAEEIVLHLGLVGSNGVDFVINNDEIHVLEVNPRIQGTFECAELALDINMAEAHLAACEDKLIEVNKPNKFVVKRVYNAPETSHVGNLNLPFVHDIPLPGVIIESGEPVCTVLVAGKNLDNCLNKTRSILENVNQKLTPSLSL